MKRQSGIQGIHLKISITIINDKTIYFQSNSKGRDVS